MSFFKYTTYLVLFSCLRTTSLSCLPISIEKEPCAVAYTPNSVLANPPSEEYLRFAGKRPRFSTCGGVCWFQGNKYLIAVNMQTSSVQTYKFHQGENFSLTPVRSFDNADGMDLKRPEGLSISKNNKFLVIPNMGSGQVKIYKTDQKNFFNPKPIASVQGFQPHGAQFSPDNKFVAYAGLGKDAKICIFRIAENATNIELIPTQEFKNQFEPLRPKTLDFSKDGRFVAIGHCMQLGNREGLGKGLVAIYEFDKKKGSISPEPVSTVDKDLFSVETLTFAPDSSCFFVTDQINDRIIGHEFDVRTGKIGKSSIVLKNPDAQLSFPHGIAFSPDGKFVAVSNYGDDKVTIYRVEKNTE